MSGVREADTGCVIVWRVFYSQLTGLDLAELDADVRGRRRRSRSTRSRASAVSADVSADRRQTVRTSGLAVMRARSRSSRAQKTGDVRPMKWRAARCRGVRVRRVTVRSSARRTSRVMSRTIFQKNI